MLHIFHVKQIWIWVLCFCALLVCLTVGAKEHVNAIVTVEQTNEEEYTVSLGGVGGERFALLLTVLPASEEENIRVFACHGRVTVTVGQPDAQGRVKILADGCRASVDHVSDEPVLGWYADGNVRIEDATLYLLDANGAVRCVSVLIHSDRYNDFETEQSIQTNPDSTIQSSPIDSNFWPSIEDVSSMPPPLPHPETQPPLPDASDTDHPNDTKEPNIMPDESHTDGTLDPGHEIETVPPDPPSFDESRWPLYRGCRETTPQNGAYTVQFLFDIQYMGDSPAITVLTCDGGGTLFLTIESLTIQEEEKQTTFTACTFRGLRDNGTYHFCIATQTGQIRVIYSHGRFIGQETMRRG